MPLSAASIVRMICGVILRCGTTMQGRAEKNRMSPSSTAWMVTPLVDFANVQRVGRRLGDFVSPLREQGVNLAHEWGWRCRCHRFRLALLLYHYAFCWSRVPICLSQSAIKYIAICK